MADKQITELPVSAGITNETQIPAYQPGALTPAQKITGAQIAAFAEAQANEAATEAGRAAGKIAGAEAGKTAGAEAGKTAGAEAGAAAAAEAGAEAGRTAGAEAGKTAGAEAGKTAGAEAGTAAGKTAGAEAGKTAGADAGKTAGTTAGTAAGKTAGAEAGKTAGAEAGRTAGAEAGKTAGATAGAEAGAEAGATAGEQAAGNLQRGATFTPHYDGDSNTLSWTNDLGLPNPDPVGLNIDTVSRLATPRSIHTKLSSTAAASFDGSADVTPGVTGVLPIANGGTGAATADTARSNLGAVSKAGDTLTGNLIINRSSYPSFRGIDTTQGRGFYLDYSGGAAATLFNIKDGSNRSGLFLNAETAALDKALQLTRTVSGSATVYNVLHTGNYTDYVVPKTGTLPVANGGTGAATAAAALDNLGAATRPNLLDNWCFLPGYVVNQRGQTSYTTRGYSVDRWLGERDSPVSVAADGLAVSAEQVIIQECREDVYEQIKGRVVTASILLSDGTFATNSGVFDDNNNVRVQFTGGEFLCWAFPNAKSFQLGRIHVFDGTSTIIAVKLELGDTQTLAHQDEDGNWVLNEYPDYSEQLLRCCMSTAVPGDDYANNKRTPAAIGAVSKANVVTGTYTGTGVIGTAATITVGFEPSAVFILRSDSAATLASAAGKPAYGMCIKFGDSQGRLTSAMMSSASNTYTVFNGYIEITSTGFSVLKYHSSYENSLNEANVVYTYFAIL